MSYEVPSELRYVESHEWVRQDGETVRVGISDFAQDELGDVVFVELPEVGDELDAGDAYGVVESIKAVSDLYAPVGGTVTARNDDLFDTPELVNQEPFEGGWMIELELDDEDEVDDLLTAEEYEEQIR